MSNTVGATFASELKRKRSDDEASGLGSCRFSSSHSEPQAIPPIKAGLKVHTILGNGALIKVAHNGGDIKKLVQWFSSQVAQNPKDASLLLDLALLHLIEQRPQEAYRLQAQALERQQIFRVVGSKGEEVPTRRRVLALVAPGDFMNNAQLEFILDGSDIGLDVLYMMPGKPLPAALPEHDVAFCAVNESDENQPVLRLLSTLLANWPRPVLNNPEQIAHLSRDGVSSVFADDRNLCVPRVRRVERADLERVAGGQISPENLSKNLAYPVLLRPVGSHCGKNLEKIDDAAALSCYLREMQDDQDGLFLGSFIDYRSADGMFRKYRITMIEGIPYLCHMAVSEQWKIHYVNVGMAESVDKRAQEARAMGTFDQDFAQRHRAAFASIWEKLGLDYIGIDCGELPDGRLVIFEIETAMVVHRMDSATLYPYKQPQMNKVFAAFNSMIERATARAAGLRCEPIIAPARAAA
jgi:hypothetical protein